MQNILEKELVIENAFKKTKYGYDMALDLHESLYEDIELPGVHFTDIAPYNKIDIWYDGSTFYYRDYRKLKALLIGRFADAENLFINVWHGVKITCLIDKTFIKLSGVAPNSDSGKRIFQKAIFYKGECLYNVSVDSYWSYRDYTSLKDTLIRLSPTPLTPKDIFIELLQKRTAEIQPHISDLESKLAEQKNKQSEIMKILGKSE